MPRRSDVVVELWPRGQPARDRLVERPALLARLVRSPAPLAVLTAPAGYGKTTLLAQWEKCDARPFIWIDVTEHDDDVAGVLGALDGRRGPIVVVLDNAHALRWADTPGVVAAVAARLGAGSTVALASRGEPPLPLARLRAQGSVLELGARSLAMSTEQATELLTLAGLDAERAEVRGIVRRSEGWPAALRLAAGALREQGDDGVAPVTLRGDDRVLGDYVRLEVLAGLNADEQDLLVRTSPFERLCGALCDAVLDRAGSGLVLRELARGGVPLIPLDRAEQEFRLHPLVAAVLRSELQRAEPHLERAIHRRASAWFEQAGERDRAIDAAITAGDLDRAAALIGRLAPSLARDGRAHIVQQWLDRLDERAVAARPVLAVAAALTRIAHGDLDVAERWTAVAERGLSRAPAAAAPARAAAVAALRACIARDGLMRMRRDAAHCLSLCGDDSPWRSVANLLEGVALQLSGLVEDARAALEQAARLARVRLPVVRALSLAQLALLEIEAGDCDEAAHVAGLVLADLGAASVRDEPACALAFAVAADALTRVGRVEEARTCATRALRLAADLAEPPAWYDAELRIALARTELRLSDAPAARDLLTKASRAARHVAERAVLQRWIDDAWARADTFAAGAAAGPETLTIAELRVMRFLPSHLSFREIATRLHVSPNTVKTQAHAVYRKLDASSRSEAVGRAREVGLVDG